VLTVAHLIPQKGIDYLIRGVGQARNRELQLIVAGDGPQLEALKTLAREQGIVDRVRFVGLSDDIPALLNEADIFCHPAIWEEAFGLTIAEAMANERPVIATRIGGIPELVEHQRSGLLVEPQSADDIAEALDLLSDQPELRAQLAKNARAKAQERFNLARCAAEHVKWCEEAATRPATPRKLEVRAQQNQSSSPH
jgi:L-malate glycosyltransferase